jgi:hypothetical protein
MPDETKAPLPAEEQPPELAELTPAQRLALIYPRVEWTPDEVDYLVRSGRI